MRFQGFVGKKEILILLDSGSAATFISDELASQLHREQVACEKIKYSTADGSPLKSAVHVPNFQWYIQGHSFAYHTRVLPIKGFDMILGADWLEDHSPMWIHWKKKLLKLPLNGKRIQLKGIRPVVTKCAKVSVHKLKGLNKNHAITHCVHLQAISPAADHDSLIFPVTHSTEITTPSSVPLPDSVPPVVQELVQQYQQPFQETQTLPPSRSFDHKIPLVPEAQPVNVRPYRYAPHQKNEIEKQVHDMLQRGIIQKSISSFASLVLSVKKKDGTWCFCVDYRQLNAITVKDKHPPPIVDELLDELHEAKWFSKLDCRSGNHQIRVAVGDKMKTTFTTHHELYEFKVMPFGLTNAPATFQCAMNELFAPLLRKGVLVFMDDILVYSSTLGPCPCVATGKKTNVTIF